MTCPTCNGKKRLTGPDGSKFECYVCKGTGRVPDTVPDPTKD